MHQRAIIFHGTGGRPDVCWYPWLAEQLTANGYEVEVPFYPEINQESIETFAPKVLAKHTINESTVLIGHSGGAPLILSLLERIESPVKQAILVAGYSTPPNANPEPVLQKTYNWNKIKQNSKQFYFINSIDDPYGCDDKQGRVLFDKLGGRLIICDEGHFGSPDQEYNDFLLLKQLIV
ncbi:MAG TPA: alpha/beta hydrolase [Candidatus Saccharimonadales bacterium]|nr:alpha/beta hydrolase [Candidatus Saccharimonadales bacterium]